MCLRKTAGKYVIFQKQKDSEKIRDPIMKYDILYKKNE